MEILFEYLIHQGLRVVFFSSGIEDRLGDDGNFVKDLNVVLQEGEDISNVVLVENDSSFVAYDQKPCIQAFDLTLWAFTYEQDSALNFKKNAPYFLIGFFERFFSNTAYHNMPFREARKSQLG